MRIEKWGFLLSYAIYLFFCIAFSIFSTNEAAINTMIFAITIASTAFSISDLLFTKFSIDKKERESLFGLHYLTKQVRNFYINKIRIKYGQKNDKMASLLMDLFEENQDELMNFFEGKLSLQEQENFLDKVKAYSNDELTEFIVNFMKSDHSEDREVIFEDDEKNIYEILNKQKKIEMIKFSIASSIAVLGLVALLVILTLRISAIPYINNVLTVVAFLFVIINLILKEYYKANSLKNMEQQKKKLLNDLKSHNDS